MSELHGELYEELFLIARLHLTKGNSLRELEEDLKRKTDDIVLVTVVIKDAKTRHNEEMQKAGTQYIIVGSVLGLLGFMLTLLHFGSNSFEYALFGFTTIGISLVFWGLFKMIG